MSRLSYSVADDHTRTGGAESIKLGRCASSGSRGNRRGAGAALAGGLWLPVFVYSGTLRQRRRRCAAFTGELPAGGSCGRTRRTTWTRSAASCTRKAGTRRSFPSWKYAMARRLGIPGSRIVCNGAHKPRSWLEQAVAEGALVQFDHFDELLLLEDVARTRGGVWQRRFG